MNLRSLFCRHTRVQIMRAHKLSITGTARWRQHAALDRHGCYVLIRCLKCGKFLTATSEPLYDTVENHVT